jgi:molybdopterin-guanine dinucleotide biosynthesis protein
MRTIVVSGKESGVGKTYVAQRLLNIFSRWGALKVTVSKKGSCPHGKSCGICGEIKKPFYIIKDSKIINEAGKDTARLKASGAKEVIWLKARPEGLAEGLNKALVAFSNCDGVVIEGTSVLKFLRPDINIHVYAKGKYKLCFLTPITVE